MPEPTLSQLPLTSLPLFEEEARKYLEANPAVAEQLQRANSVYATFGRYLSLTQTRTIIRESGGSTAEADLSATILRTDL